MTEHLKQGKGRSDITKKPVSGVQVVYTAACVFVLILIFAAICIAVKTILVSRSLWLDEAMLAESVITRSLGELFASPLLNVQSAPFLYLFAVKILTMLFGSSETVLRVFSFLGYLGTIVLTSLLLKKAFRINMLIALTGACLVASFVYFVRYANEFKPYMSDGFFVLLILYLYHLYLKQAIGLKTMTACMAVSLWFANSVCFFVAAILMWEFLAALHTKNWTNLRPIIISGLIVTASFMLNYYIWLRPVAEGGIMTDFWRDYEFKILTYHIEDFKRNFKLVSRLFVIFFQSKFLYIIMAFAGFVFALVKKDRITIVAGIAMILLLFASNFSRYPIVFRMMMFFYILIIIYSMVAIGRLRFIKSKYIDIILKTLVVLVMLYGNYGLYVLWEPQNVYINGEEANGLIEYVRDNIKEDELVYVLPHAMHIFKYKNNYNEAIIGNFTKPNVLAGCYSTKDLIFEEIEMILESGKNCYILVSHTRPDRYTNLLAELTKYGKLRLVMEIKETPLFYFVPDKAKAAAFLDARR